MADRSFMDILECCLHLEGLAIKAYAQMADRSTNGLRTFWLQMHAQEKEHAKYWKLLIGLAQENKIKNIFDDPDQIKQELKHALESAQDLYSHVESGDVEQMFLMAYRLEFTLMHPAFQALFLFMRNLTGDASPADNYHDHITGLIEAYREHAGKKHRPFELIADLSEKLLERNEQIAAQMAELRVIRGLIPICMHCKNIRKDDGFWVKVEHYIEDHSDAEFSHGICPDCMKKYYSEYFTEEELNNQK